jgi:hypothetical protein
VNGIVRYSRGDNHRGLTVTGQGTWADWQSTDQIPARAVRSGALSRFSAVDPSDRGAAHRQSLAAEVQRGSGASSFRASAFALRSSMNLFSNFTYFLDDPSCCWSATRGRPKPDGRAAEAASSGRITRGSVAG